MPVKRKSKKQRQGQQTHKSGKKGCGRIEKVFKDAGISIIMHSQWVKNQQEYQNTKVLLRSHEFINFFNTTAYMDYVLYDNNIPVLAIEVKTQRVAGSTDEKLMFMVMNAMKQNIWKFHIVACIGTHWVKGRGKQYILGAKKFADMYEPGKVDIMVLADIKKYLKNTLV